MIKIDGLTKNFGETQALKGVSLHVKEGELFAYLGPNGSGKTTTINILTGLTVPTSGDVYLNGHHITRETLAAKAQNGVVNQTINLDMELSVYENLLIHGMLFNMRRGDMTRRIDELLEYIEMIDKKNVLIKTLSGGLKRRLMIARALMHRPRILFLDEPTVGLDPAIRRRIWSLIRRIQQDGATIFLTTHYIEEAEFLADRVAFLDAGKVVTVNTPFNLMRGLGEWAVDELVEGEIRTSYFTDKEEAHVKVAENEGSVIVRRINLEDVFIHMTGKNVSSEYKSGISR